VKDQFRKEIEISVERFDKDKTGPAEETLNDLPVTNDQAEETKGGDEFSFNYAKVDYRITTSK